MITLPTLYTPETKGSKLTRAEMTWNLTQIRNTINALGSILSASLNDDGTIRDDSVETDAITDRMVTQAKLALNFFPAAADTGTTNSMAITVTPAPTALASFMCFIVVPSNTNTGAVTLNVAGLGAISVVKQGGSALEAGDIKAAAPVQVVYHNSVFHLLGLSASGGSEVTGGSSSGTSRMDAYLEDLPNETPYEYVVPHGLNSVPSTVLVALVCQQDAGFAGYGFGESVDVSAFQLTDGSPAFAVSWDATNVNVTMLGDGMPTAAFPVVKLVDKSSDATRGTMRTILQADWKLSVSAELTLAANPTTIFPPVSILAMNPQAGCSYGSYVYYFTASSASARTHLQRWNVQTNEVEHIAAFDALFDAISCSPWKWTTKPAGFTSNESMLVLAKAGTAVFRLYAIDLSNGYGTSAPLVTWTATPSVITPGNLSYWKVGWVEEGTPNTYYLIPSSYYSTAGTHDITSLRGFYFTDADTSDPTFTEYGSSMNLMSETWGTLAQRTAFLAFMPSGNPRILLWQNNPFNKRIYLMTSEDGLLHVFNIEASSSRKLTAIANYADWFNDDSDTGAYGRDDRLVDLAYEGAVAVAGLASALVSGRQGNMTVEFDLASGEEKALVMTSGARMDGTTVEYPGNVSRFPLVIPF